MPDTHSTSEPSPAADQATPELGAISRWAEAMSEAIAERNRAIRKAVAAGHSQRAVARAAGLTHPAVGKIVERGEPD